MNYNRRQFLQTTGMLTAGSLLMKNAMASTPGIKMKNFGLQLWTVKEDMAKDPKGVLKQVAADGYTEIEGFEGGQGIFWGMTPAEMEGYMRDLGMKFVSSHCDIDHDFEKKAIEAGSIGMDFLICPYKGPQKTADDFKRIADQFNKCGEICRKYNVTFGYHNHDYSFKPVDGQIPMDILLQNTDEKNVSFELDLYWAITAGADPIHYFNQYDKRFRLVHVKDRAKDAAPGDTDASCIVGQGSINWEPLLHHAKMKGVRFFIVEQEKFTGSTPMDSAAADAKFMKNIIPRI